MTRALLFLSVALAAASLAVSAQGSVANQPEPSPAAAQGMQTSSTQPTNASTKANVATEPGAASTTTQSGAHPATSGIDPAIQASGNDGSAEKQLPQTSTILPLLGLIGLGSLVAGLFARR